MPCRLEAIPNKPPAQPTRGSDRHQSLHWNRKGLLFQALKWLIAADLGAALPFSLASTGGGCFTKIPPIGEIATDARRPWPTQPLRFRSPLPGDGVSRVHFGGDDRMRRIAYASVAMVGLMPVSLHAQWPFQSSAKPEAPAAAAPAPASPAAQPGQGPTMPAPYASTGLPPAANPYGAPPASGPVPIAPSGSYSPPKPAPSAPAASGCACCSTSSRPASPANYGNYAPPTAYPTYGSQPSVPISGYPSGPGYGQMGAVMPASGYSADGEAVAVARNVPGYPPGAQHASYQSSNFDRLPVAPAADTSAEALPDQPSWWRRVVLRQKTVRPPGDDFEGNFSPTPPQNVPYDPQPIISETPKERPPTSSPTLGERMFGWLPFVN